MAPKSRGYPDRSIGDGSDIDAHPQMSVGLTNGINGIHWRLALRTRHFFPSGRSSDQKLGNISLPAQDSFQIEESDMFVSKMVRLSMLVLSVSLGMMGNDLHADDKVPEGKNEQIAEVFAYTLVAYATETHLMVGVIADSYESESIEGEQAKALLEMNKTFINEIGPRLMKLGKHDEMEKDGQKFMVESGKVFKAIRAEMAALSTYIDSEDDADQEKYHQARDAAQTEMDAFLKAK